MVERYCIALRDRAVLEIAGPDRADFLQGLISNDITKVAPDRAVYAALLTAQGKYLHDFFVMEMGDAFYLDAEAGRLPDLMRRLGLYRLRAKVTLTDGSDRYAVAVAFGEGALDLLDLPGDPGTAVPFGGGIAYADPRLTALGARLLLPRGMTMAPLEAAGFTLGQQADYDRLRLSLGVPDGSRDLAVEKAILLESGFDELNGVDWKKGCYVGQELTARTKYRGLVKKRLMPVVVEGPLPAPGTPVMLGDQEAGEMRSGQEGIALALLRLEAVDQATEEQPLMAGAARLKPQKPEWTNF